MIRKKTPEQILKIQDQMITDCKDYRKNWEKNALEVDLSYRGIKFPEYNFRTGERRNQADKPVVVNIVKRQHRSIQNYFLNNEPGISVRKKIGMSYADLAASKMLLERDFVESEFYEEEMDEITDYGLKR